MMKHMIYKPEVAIKQDLIENTNEVETKKLCCCIESYPTPTLTRWWNGNLEIFVAYNKTDICYTISNVSRYDQGIYTCRAENIVGIGLITTVLEVKYKPLVSIMHDLIEEMNEGETTKLCCFVDSNTAITSTRWLNGSQEISVKHYVTETCCTIENVSRYDSGNYTCKAENIIGIGSVIIALKVKLMNNCIMKFIYPKKKKYFRRISRINSETPRGNDDESGHYMEIYMIDDNIVTPWQENTNPIISTVERAVVENRDMTLMSAGHSSTSSDNDRNDSEYLDNGYEHPYNTLLVSNRAEDKHVYLTTKKKSNNENSTPFENAPYGCSFEFTEQDFSLDKPKTQCCANDGEENNESEL
ncbi:unnamed protein product [Mytilus coruscus]|uniref:Ig-like domain-containing protein n=1 Tax=Mytilus coruscus TaxID=42192 RepID=A0A6J8B6D9_MYTCO|nr:unnamed protein product [Mytilus coruscus]